jgi:hypothetical protein
MSLSPTSELEAINTMLTSIGEQPVQSIVNLAGLSDASIAQQILLNVSRSVQSRGWIFNTDLDEVLTPATVGDNKGVIVLGDNVLRVDTTNRIRTSTQDIIERGRKLWDRKNNTDVFTEGTKISVDQVKLLSFKDLPEPARRFITLRSARIFHDRVVGSDSLHKFFKEDEEQAWTQLLDYEGEVADYNIFDNYDVYRVLDRGPYPTFSLTKNLIDSTETA